MPIEIQVPEGVSAGKQQAPDRLELRRRCRSYAAEWVDIQRESSRRLGIWGEWEHPYLMDAAFEAESWRRSPLSRAARSSSVACARFIGVPRSDRAGEAEIEYRTDRSLPSRSPSHCARPEARPRWTRRARGPGVDHHPWTLPANLGLMVAPEASYVVVETEGRRFVIAEARAAAVAEACGWKRPRSAAGCAATICWASSSKDRGGTTSRVVDGSPTFDLEDGTGLVHTAPGHARRFRRRPTRGLGVVNPVDEAGRFTSGPVAVRRPSVPR